MSTKTLRYFFILNIFLLSGTLSCNKERNLVPVTSINITVFDVESDPRYSNLRIRGNSIKLISPDCLGYNCNGVILFRLKNEQAYDDYKAYDLTCTFEANSCAMEIDTSFSDLLTCPCCGSVFNLEGGYMEKGPARFPLREFQCDFFEGDLRIY
jgi:nitrite reductase/ring-hydroxylating ferredoxin subunit